MGSAIFGLLLGFGIAIASVFHLANNKAIFLDPMGILIVVGCTFAAAFITFPAKKVIELSKIMILVLRKQTDEAPALVKEIIELARETGAERSALQSSLPRIHDPFFKEGVGLIVDRFDADRIEVILRDRIRVAHELHESHANMLKTLGKYPPAFGLVGTVIGLVALLEGMGGEGGAKNLGPAMAVGLVATLYGLIVANLVFVPMGENLAYKSTFDMRKRRIAMVAVMLLKANETPLVIQETLNSMLRIHERVDVLGVGGGNTGRNAA